MTSCSDFTIQSRSRCLLMSLQWLHIPSCSAGMPARLLAVSFIVWKQMDDRDHEIGGNQESSLWLVQQQSYSPGKQQQVHRKKEKSLNFITSFCSTTALALFVEFGANPRGNNNEREFGFGKLVLWSKEWKLVKSIWGKWSVVWLQQRLTVHTEHMKILCCVLYSLYFILSLRGFCTVAASHTQVTTGD